MVDATARSVTRIYKLPRAHTEQRKTVEKPKATEKDAQSSQILTSLTELRWYMNFDAIEYTPGVQAQSQGEQADIAASSREKSEPEVGT
jgi:hypothetical protein